MRMLSRFIAATVLVGASLNLAHAAEPANSFTHEGVTYVYTTKEIGKTKIVSGSISPDRKPFSLRIRGNRVSGVIAGRYVSFLVKDSAQAMKSTRTQVTMR